MAYERSGEIMNIPQNVGCVKFNSDRSATLRTRPFTNPDFALKEADEAKNCLSQLERKGVAPPMRKGEFFLRRRNQQAKS